jgi:hypothetical protein
MNEPQPNPGRRYDTERALATVRETVRELTNPTCRENYLRSCENHGGELAVIVQQVRQELNKA